MRVAAFCRSVMVTLESGDNPVALTMSAVVYRLEPCTRMRTRWYCSGAASLAMEMKRQKKNSSLQLRIELGPCPTRESYYSTQRLKRPKMASSGVFAFGPRADS